jgi:hypothetical protein
MAAHFSVFPCQARTSSRWTPQFAPRQQEGLPRRAFEIPLCMIPLRITVLGLIRPNELYERRPQLD